MLNKNLTVFFCSICLLGTAQKVNWKKIKSFAPDNVLLHGDTKPVKVLLLGTFHFGYPNLDGHKTDSSKFVNVKSPERQAELEQLATVIMQFKPTRIYVESTDGPWIDSLYSAYLNNTYKLGRNEIFQVGFRVAAKMKHTKIYAADTWPFSSQHSNEFKWIDSLWEHSLAADSVRDKYWNKKYKAYYDNSDSADLALTMLENFLLMAEPATLQRMHGHYLAADFNTVPLNDIDDGQQGPDRLSVWWYNRNLRIFNNILRTKPTAADRIMVLFGNGHMPILKHCFSASPQFEVVELKSLLR